jgi:GNAT superfamily N-acetyltransferase
MLIRPATPADALALVEVHIACWREAYADLLPRAFLDSLSVDAFLPHRERALADPARINFIAEIDGEPVGFASCGRSRDADANLATGELYGIYLRAQHWDQGRGHQLWLAVRTPLSEAHLNPITLWVFEANTRARRFYERVGFTLQPGISKSFERDGVRLPEVRYELLLNIAP